MRGPLTRRPSPHLLPWVDAEDKINCTMTDLPEPVFLNPVWHALHGPHQHLAIVLGDACRYPADVSPFAAIRAPTDRALDELHRLLAPHESVWLVDYGRTLPGLEVIESLECLQMVLPADAEPPLHSGKVVPLAAADAREMVALTDVAFPGFFRSRTHLMGSYWGVRLDGALVAMGGERLRLDGHPELSGICTHPLHRGKGLASDIIGRLVRCHRRDGLRSWLHVGARNTHAIGLYMSLGFQRVRSILLHRIARSD
jgi:ribosomal protein S18 acetylase RimI-like enzyme